MNYETDFGTNAGKLGTVRVAKVTGGRNIGTGLLLFNLEFHFRPEARGATIIELGGAFTVKKKNGGSHQVTTLRPHGGTAHHEIQNPDYTLRIDVVAELTRWHIEALEDVRDGREEVDFDVFLWGHVQREAGPVGRALANMPARVNQSDWVNALRTMEYDRRMLLEVPVGVGGAGMYLKDAQRAMLHGHYREAVGHCRLAMEALAHQLGDQEVKVEYLQQLFAGQRGMDKVARLQLLRKAFTVVTHPPHHVDDVTLNIEWGRADAHAAVSIAAAILNWVHEAGRV